MNEQVERLKTTLFRPLTHTSPAWFIWVLILLVGVGAGGWAYSQQLQKGLAVTGLRDTVVWGVYISNFVFFSGLSMAGTFISAILRITGAEWRRSITRLAELTTVSALMICGLMPIIDMGRPDRVLNMILYGRIESPLVWDVLVITTYLAASAIYLYLFLIPDSAVLRDDLNDKVSGFRQRLYTLVALGWRNLPEQHRRLSRASTIMMLLVMPIGLATHSVVSWIFGMTFRAGWDSTIFAPYFAVGALYSGTAMLITLMIVLRRVYHLEEYYTEKHFRYLAYMLAAFGALYFYFTFAEYLTAGYKLDSADRLLLDQLFFGSYSIIVWPSFIGGQVLPVLLVLHPRLRKLPVLFVASLLVNVGMWIKRFVIIVPTLSMPLLPYQWGVYDPTLVELLITVGSFAGFGLLITLFAKLFPIISVCEMQEGWEKVEHRPAKPAEPKEKGPRRVVFPWEVGGAPNE